MVFELLLTEPHVPEGGEGVKVRVGDSLSDEVTVRLGVRVPAEALGLLVGVAVRDGV